MIINLVLLTFAYTTLARAQGCWGACSSATARTAPARTGLLQPIADLVKLDPQGELLPGRGDRHPLHHRARRLGVHGAARRSRSSRTGPGGTSRTTTSTAIVANVSICADPGLRARLDRDLRLHRRRLGVVSRSTRCSARCAPARSSSPTRSRSRSAVLGVVIMASSLSLVEHRRQRRAHSLWYVVPQAVGFLVFLISGVAETSRAAVRPARGGAASSSPATTPSTRGCAGACSRWPST